MGYTVEEAAAGRQVELTDPYEAAFVFQAAIVRLYALDVPNDEQSCLDAFLSMAEAAAFEEYEDAYDALKQLGVDVASGTVNPAVLDWSEGQVPFAVAARLAVELAEAEGVHPK